MRPAVGDMTHQIKNRFASQKEQKDEKKDRYKHLTVQEKGGKNQLKPFLSQEKWYFLLGSHPVFLPFFPWRKAVHHPCPMCQFFFLLFLLFPKRSVFLFYFLLCHKFIRTSAEHLFRSREKFVILTSFWQMEIANGLLLNS